MSRAVVLYLHAHQPYRVRDYTVFDIGTNHNYFTGGEPRTNNEQILAKVAEKSYLPTNQVLMELLDRHPEFRLSLSITGTLLEQLEAYHPEALKSFQNLVATGRVEIVAETYHHSLAFFYSLSDFEIQVKMHADIVERLFGVTPQVFRNTELAYNNELGRWVEGHGYKGILAEGWDPVLTWRSPNFVYRPKDAANAKLLLKNYKLSDDIAFRFSDQNWSEWPLTADKFLHWLDGSGEATNFNLFMDYETFGEHQWEASGIFDFLRHFPAKWLQNPDNTFLTVSEAMDAHEAVDEVDMPNTITWADTERDLSAWLGNSMQQSAIKSLYDLEKPIHSTGDWSLIEDWRKLQTSDHFYYMCTKWFNDGDIHAYFSPYQTPYIAYLAFMNAWHDLKARLLEKGVLL